MLLSFAIIRGTFVTVHHDPATDRVGVIMDVKTTEAVIVDRTGSVPTEQQYFACSKALLNEIPPDQWQPGRPMVLTVVQNADGRPIDVATLLFDKNDNPLNYVSSR